MDFIFLLCFSLFCLRVEENGTTFWSRFFYSLKVLVSAWCIIIAFDADIQFWNKNKSMEGLSARSVVINFFCQLIVFLYLLDNDTSWMIILSAGMGCCIEFWKIGKAMHIEVFSLRFMLLFVYLDFCAMSCTPTCNQLRILCVNATGGPEQGFSSPQVQGQRILCRK